MKLNDSIMRVPFGILLGKLTPAELAVLVREVIDQGLVRHRTNKTETIHEMPVAGISIESMGIN